MHVCDVVFKTFLTYEEVKIDQETLRGTVIKNINNEWKLLSFDGRYYSKNLTSVKFSFSIERYSGTLYKHVVVPGYCLIALTLTILWMNPSNPWRLITCGVNIYLHFTLMDRIWWK